MHRSSAPAATPEGFYRLNYYYAFLDHVIAHLEMRFPKELKNVMLGYYLLPCHLNQLMEQLEESIVEEYNNLPMPDTFGIEVGFYKLWL